MKAYLVPAKLSVHLTLDGPVRRRLCRSCSRSLTKRRVLMQIGHLDVIFLCVECTRILKTRLQETVLYESYLGEG